MLPDDATVLANKWRHNARVTALAGPLQPARVHLERRDDLCLGLWETRNGRQGV